MNQIDIQTLMDQAMAMDYGLSISAPNPCLAKHYRRKFYAVRETLRKDGNHNYDDLSFVLKNKADLWIIKREAINPPPKLLFINSRPLMVDELPSRILSRGKSRMGLCIS